MPAAPDPHEVYERSAAEGARRLNASHLETSATAFIAGFTIVFGIVASGIVHALVAPRLGTELGQLAGALAFGIGLVFTVVGRTDLFTENFLDPVAATLEQRPGSSWRAVARLWVVVLALNLVGGTALALVLTVEGALPNGAPEALARAAEDIRVERPLASFTNAMAAGALLTLMTFLLQASDSVAARVAVAYLVGFFLAIGPFNHVVVTSLHLIIGMRYAADVGLGDLATSMVVSTGGNIVGGLLFVTITQTVRAKDRG